MDEKTTTQVARLAIVKPMSEQRELWNKLSVSVQRLRNTSLVVWRRWHEDQGHGQAMHQWMESLKAWHREKQRLEEAAKPAEKPTSPKEKRLVREAKATVKRFVRDYPKPTCPCSPLPNELGRAITTALAQAFPDLPGMTRATAAKILMDTWCKAPSSKGAFRKWQCALAGLGELMVFSRPQPIPLHNTFIRLIPPDTHDGDWRVGLKIERIERDGKAANPETIVIVQTKGKACRKLRGALEMLAAGRGKWCGSNLVPEKGRWYLHLVYKQPVEIPPELSREIVAVLEPGVDHPWSLLVSGRDDWLVGRNRLLAWHRRRLRRERSTKTEAYREGQIGKGHGRGRFDQDSRFRNRLAGYKATLAKASAAKAVAACVRAGAGTLIYRAPTEGNMGRTFLQTSGCTPQRPDSFCWFVVKSQLERNCEKAGIVLKIEAWAGPPECEGSGGAETPGTSRGGASAGDNRSCANGNGKAIGKEDRKGSGQQEPSKKGAQCKRRQGVRRGAVAKGK